MTLGRFVLLAPLRSSSVLSLSIRMTSAGPPPPKPSKPGSLFDRYDKFVARWPKVYPVHRLVIDGSRWCFHDIKIFWRVKRDLRAGKKLSDLSLAELEVLVQSGGEIAKMLLLMAVLDIPVAGELLILLVIFYPRLILTRHFWSDQQRKEFFLKDVNKALKDVKASEVPISASSITGLIVLSRFHGFIPFFGVQRRLETRSQALKTMDNILKANLDTLSSQQLYFHMYIRRLSYSNHSDDEIREKLRQWLSFSSELTGFAYLTAPYYVNKD